MNLEKQKSKAHSMFQRNQNSSLQQESRGICELKLFFIKYKCFESLGENNFEIIKIKIIAQCRFDQSKQSHS